MSVRITVTMTADHELLTSLNRLLPQLSDTAGSLTNTDLIQLVATENLYLLVARVDNTIVGVLTLVLYRLPTGLRARIEDVVVDDVSRGHGIGRALTTHAIEIAKKSGARNVDLTSRPSRVEANLLYQKMGFNERESNNYRLAL